MTHSTSYHDLEDALVQPGCPICRLNAAAAQRYLDALLWEMVNDPEVRQKIRLAQGFCNAHAWLMARNRGTALGVAIIHHDVLSTLLETLGSTVGNSPSRLRAVRDALAGERTLTARAAASRLEPQGECPACAHVSESERRHLSALVENFPGNERLRTLFRSSEGLCQAHLRQALQQARNEPTLDSLMTAQSEIWERLKAQLSEFIRKNDYRYAGEPMGEEGDAWLRSIGAVSGAPS